MSISDSPSWSLEASIGDVNTGNTTFNYTVEAVNAVLEVHGVSLFLTKSFQWSKGEELQIRLRGDASAQFDYLWNVDVRFGTIYPVLQPL